MSRNGKPNLRPIGRVAIGKTALRRAGAVAQPWKAGGAKGQTVELAKE